MSRNGKIARLPREIRDKLNHRLHNGETAVRLVDWLNSLPEVQATLDRDFGGRNISEQNVSEWKAGGYREWRTRKDSLELAREFASDATELTDASGGRLTDHLATVLASFYAAVLSGWNGEVTEDLRRKVRLYRCLCQDITDLRRGDHSGARLKIEQDRSDREREKSEEEVLGIFEHWAKNPIVRDCLRELDGDARTRRLREIFGREQKKPESQNGASEHPDQTKSN